MAVNPSQRATEVEARAILAEWTPELEAERLKLCLNVVERADAYGGSAARLYHEAEMALTLLGDIVSRAQAAITALDAHRAGGVDDGLALARRFHEAYERLAPSFGYETRAETRDFDPTTPNGQLMVAVCTELRAARASTPDGGGAG